jgi:hypothetical protein
MIASALKKTKSVIEIDFVRFCMVGGTGFVINMTLLLLFRRYLGMAVFYAQLIAAEIALFCNFILHNHWTYKKHNVNKSISKLIIQFHVTSWPAILGSAAMVTFFVDIMKLTNIIALIISSGVALLWNFTWSKYVVWRDLSINNKEMIE